MTTIKTNFNVRAAADIILAFIADKQRQFPGELGDPDASEEYKTLQEYYNTIEVFLGLEIEL
jgi:hypothetical protein